LGAHWLLNGAHSRQDEMCRLRGPRPTEGRLTKPVQNVACTFCEFCRTIAEDCQARSFTMMAAHSRCPFWRFQTRTFTKALRQRLDLHSVGPAV
jgi:hypothetical protein